VIEAAENSGNAQRFGQASRFGLNDPAGPRRVSIFPILNIQALGSFGRLRGHGDSQKHTRGDG
jgi:hypothetical protein